MKVEYPVRPVRAVKRTRAVLNSALRDAAKNIKFCTHRRSRPYVQIPDDGHDDLALTTNNTRECLDCYAVFERGLV